MIGSVAVAGTLSAVSDLSGGHLPRLRIFIGSCVAGAILAIMAEGAPMPAATLAITLAVSAMFLGGADLWKRIAGIFS